MFRWFALATLMGCLSISVNYRRRARREGETIPRRRENRSCWLAALSSRYHSSGRSLTYLVDPRWMVWASFTPPVWSRRVGVGLGVLTVPAAYWVFRSLGRNVSETVLTKEHHELVTHGVYRWIRHPLYTTGIVLILAIGLMAANWLILLFALIALVSIRVVVVPVEEQALLTTFGDEYRDYMQRTGRLLPRVREGR